jgi:sugar/nucleoside kinase (ribokinase family)
VRFACASGALATTCAGALPSLPDRDAVEALVAKRKGSRAS